MISIYIGIFWILLAIAAVSDVLTMRIPNSIILLLLVFFVPFSFSFMPAFDVLTTHLSVGLSAFLVALTLFYLGLWGGGDAKLFSVSALWLGWPAIIPYVFWTTISGGLLALLIVLWSLLQREASSDDKRSNRERLRALKVPYGVALVFGAIMASMKSPLLAP